MGTTAAAVESFDSSMAQATEKLGFDKQDALRLANLAARMLSNGSKNIGDALAVARAAVCLHADSGLAWNVLSAGYHEIPDAAPLQTAAAREAVRLLPNEPTAWHNLSLGLMKAFDFDRALEASQRAMLAPGPHNPYIPIQAAFLAQLVGNHRMALEYLDDTLKMLEPGHPEHLRFRAEVEISRAIQYAKLNDWPMFCRCLSSRHELSTAAGTDVLHALWKEGRLWDQVLGTIGKATGMGMDALVYLEWGIGDQIQFARLIPDVLRRFLDLNRVTVACAAPLVRLMESLPGIDSVVDQATLTATRIPRTTLVIPVIDLIEYACLRGDSFPPGKYVGAYLTAPSEVPGLSVRHSSAVMSYEPSWKDGPLVIAFGWQGDPRQTHDFNRHVPFRFWADFARRTRGKYKFASLQTRFGGHSEPWPSWPANVALDDNSGLIGDMGDVAELMGKCDVFVGQCGALLHLAGSLGRPAVGLLGYAHDWRWDFEPLYDFELVTQKRPGDWPSVFDQLESAIERAVNRLPAAIPKER